MRQIKTLVRDLNNVKASLCDSRDKLRDLQDEVEAQLADKDEEIANLESVIDSLSKYV